MSQQPPPAPAPPGEQKPAVREQAPLIYERQPGESSRAHGAFQCYLRMGPDRRSIRKVARNLSKSATTVKEWSVKWHWQERTAAYDTAMVAKEQAAIEEEQKRRAVIWADREQAHRERRYQLGELMLSKAEKILRGRTKFTQHTASRLAQIGDKLIGLATGLPTDNTTISSPDGGAVGIMSAPAGQVHIYLPAKKALPEEPPATSAPAPAPAKA